MAVNFSRILQIGVISLSMPRVNLCVTSGLTSGLTSG
ncbi:unannotated protein [freshwater metagenome]|uniref:Unannotated protein n=1 Tax=freshwater metagenome TaxID=449393 RepID=A0A6J7BCW5_9ZZZZ